MSRLGPLFDTLRAENRRALIPYLVAGDPDEGGWRFIVLTEKTLK